MGIAELSPQPGACMAELERESGVNESEGFNWRNLHRQGLLDLASRVTLIPVTVEPISSPSGLNRATKDQPPASWPPM